MITKKTHIIAEIGTSHQGDLSKAVELIHAAKESGADTAKFQWVYADEIIHPNTGFVKLPGGNIPLYERFKALEQGPDFFSALKQACDKAGIRFLCTPFGLRSAKELLEIGAESFKIASPELNHIPMLEFLGATGLPLIVSSGVSKLADIEEALETIRGARSGSIPLLKAWAPEYALYAEKLIKNTVVPGKSDDNISLLHCMTAYPAPENEYNLLLIRTLASVFSVPLGISDHSMDPVLVPVVSTILGGTLIEKHFTMSNATDGLDDPIALAPSAFERMTKAVRAVEAVMAKEAAKAVKSASNEPGNSTASLGTGSAHQYVCDIMQTAGLQAKKNTISAILGDGKKTLAPTERANYGRTNRSIHVVKDLPAGYTLKSEDLCVIRTEKILRPGLHPRYLREIIGKKLVAAIGSGEGVRWQDLLTE